MNPDRLLTHFDSIAEAPDGVAHLRRFIVQLALRGKLVSQDPNNESALALSQRVDEEKTRLNMRFGKKGSAPRPPVRLGTSELPYGWVSVQACELFPTRSGNSKLIKGRLHSEPAAGLFPGFSAAGQDVWLDNWEHEGVAIVVSAVGARCGKAFLARGKWSAIANTHIVWLMPEITDPKFAMLHLNNESFWIRSGGAQPFIKVKETLARPFALPPIEEQRRCVAKVDELMTLCDRVETARNEREAIRNRLAFVSLSRITECSANDRPELQERAQHYLQHFAIVSTTPGPLRHLKQAVLDLAFQGHLVEQQSAQGDESQQPVAGVGRRWEIEEVKAPPLPNIPRSWHWYRIGDLVTELIGGVSTSKSDYVESGVLVFNKGNVRTYGETGFTEARNYVTKKFFDNHIDRAVLPGDMVVALRDFSSKANFLGLIGEYRLHEAALLSQGACVVRVVPWLAPRFLMLFSNCLLYRNIVKANKIGATQVHLRNGQFGGIPVPVPPLTEQQRIVNKCDELIAFCDRLEASLTSGETIRNCLLESLLHEALAPTTKNAA